MNSIINIARYLCDRYKERSGEILDEFDDAGGVTE